MNEFGGLSGQLLTIFIAFAITFLIFLLFREFWCWYWKINKVVSLQTETNELLSKILSESRRQTTLSVKNHRGDKQGQTADYDKYEL